MENSAVKQTTIKEKCVIEGVNLFNRRKCSATFYPAEKNTGIIFRKGRNVVPATLEFARKEEGLIWRTIDLKDGKARFRVVEHLLSAVYCAGIDNVVIELSSEVCPTTDNCAQEYFEILRPLLEMQEVDRRFLRYKKDLETSVQFGDKPDSLTVSKSNGFILANRIKFPHRIIGEQKFEMEVTPENYAQNVMNARPPAFTGSRTIMWMLGGLGVFLRMHGVTRKNYLLIREKDNKTYGNCRGYEARYYGEEFVRHKTLDSLGTLALTGRRFIDTRFYFNMTGHEFDLYALNELFKRDVFEPA